MILPVPGHFFNLTFERERDMSHSDRVPTSSGNHGKPGKSQIKIPCMEKSWNLIKAEKSWKNHGIL